METAVETVHCLVCHVEIEPTYVMCQTCEFDQRVERVERMRNIKPAPKPNRSRRSGGALWVGHQPRLFE